MRNITGEFFTQRNIKYIHEEGVSHDDSLDVGDYISMAVASGKDEIDDIVAPFCSSVLT